MTLTLRRNAEVIQEEPVSEWQPNLKGKGLPDVVVETFRRLHSDLQALQQQVRDSKQPVAVAETSQSVLNTFTELNIGSPATAGGGAVRIRSGIGSPETVVQGTMFKDIWFRVDGAAGTFFYVKEVGADNKTGWVAKF